MAQGKGSFCPHCNKQTFHDKGSYKKCSTCNYVGWSWQQPIKSVGKGKGNTCPNCNNQTLHHILTLEGGHDVRRCSICDFSGIEPVIK